MNIDLNEPQSHAITSLMEDERGATVLEYIILACLVIGACFVIVQQLGTSTNAKFTEADGAVNGMTFGN